MSCGLLVVYLSIASCMGADCSTVRCSAPGAQLCQLCYFLSGWRSLVFEARFWFRLPHMLLLKTGSSMSWVDCSTRRVLEYFSWALGHVAFLMYVYVL